MQVKFKMFHSAFSSWMTLFQEAAAFASQMPTDRVINVSHSCDKGEGVVAVWYWADDDPVQEELPA
ncbi:MAG: hypothetical protein U0746_01620 [Gemmataceae bacterium]